MNYKKEKGLEIKKYLLDIEKKLNEYKIFVDCVVQ